jgi:polar amino acid transport system substrate-binding protein
MSVFTRRVATGSIAALLFLAGCTAASNSPSASAAASVAESVAASVAASVAPTPVATVPTDQLSFAGKLVTCIDIPYPPQEFFDANGNPTGSDVDIANEIAKRLGLNSVIENSIFDTIIEAVNAGKCDIIVSAQNINTDRLKQVDMIPYFQAGQAFVVAKGNPKGIKTELDLCGKKVGAEQGTTEVDYMNGTGPDYKGDGLAKKCADAKKPAVVVTEYTKDSDALLALVAGQEDAYFADSPVAGYYTVQQPTQFELSGVTVGVVPEGISVPYAKKGLSAGVLAALKSMMTDGTYATILDKYGLKSYGVEESTVTVQTTHPAGV